MQKHFPVIIEQDEDQYYIVSCPVLKGCHSYGETIPEAMQNITEAILLCLEDDDIVENENSFVGLRDLTVTLS